MSASSSATPDSHRLLVELFPEQPPLVTDRKRQIHTYSSVDAIQHDPLHTDWIKSPTGGLNFKYADLCFIREFIHDVRQKYAPPTAYDIHQRSSKVLVDLNASLGWMTCSAARKHDKFTNVVANEAYKPITPPQALSYASADLYSHTASHNPSSPYYPLLQQNVALYKFENVFTTNHDFLAFFLETYAQHAPNSVVYFDVTLPTTPQMRPMYGEHQNDSENIKSGNDTDHASSSPSTPMPKSSQSIIDYEIITDYANDPHSLSELVEHLLSGKLFQTGKTTCPMIVLRVPLTYDVTRLKSLPLRECVDYEDLPKHLRSKHKLTYKIIACIGWKHDQYSVQQQQLDASANVYTNGYASGNDNALEGDAYTALSAVPSTTIYNTYNSDIYVPPRTQQQIATIVALHNQPEHPHYHLWLRLKQIIVSRLYGCPNAAEGMISELIRLCAQAPNDANAAADENGNAVTTMSANDEDIYNALHDYFENTIKTSDEWKQQEDRNDKESGRANSRVVEIMELLGRAQPAHYKNQHPAPPGIPIDNVLDLGCSEGSITAALGEALQLPVEHVHGADVRDVSNKAGITFRLLTDPNRLPYYDSTFSLITCLMSFHHMDNVEAVLNEIYRVLKPDGLLIIREHDLNPESLALVLDIQHGLYARTWAIEQATFCDNYTAHYAPREYWQQQLYNAQLYPCSWSPDAHQVTFLPRYYNESTRIKNPFNQYYGIYSKHPMQILPPINTQRGGRGGGRGRGYSDRGRGRGRGRGGGFYSQEQQQQPHHRLSGKRRYDDHATGSDGYAHTHQDNNNFDAPPSQHDQPYNTQPHPHRSADTSSRGDIKKARRDDNSSSVIEDDDFPADFDASEIAAQKSFTADIYGLGSFSTNTSNSIKTTTSSSSSSSTSDSDSKQSQSQAISSST